MKKVLIFAGASLFVLAQLAAASVTLTSPNGGEDWTIGTPQVITWTNNGLSGTVKLFLDKGGVTQVIASNIPVGDLQCPWTAGQTQGGMAVNGSDYRVNIRVDDPHLGAFYDKSNNFFTLSGGVPPPVYRAPEHPMTPPLQLLRPKLAVTDIDLSPNVDGFGIIFSYKNVGNGALPKASEVPIKPSYRVLIDGKEMASGSLFIPAFAAPPGWEQTGYFGGQIVLPTLQYAFDNNWYIGNMITVHINENKVMGMESHSLTLRLKPIALKYRFDLVRNGITLDWNTGTLTVSLRLDGNVPAGRELLVYSGYAPSYDNYFLVRKPATPGTCVVSKKLSFIRGADSQVSLYLNSYVTVPDVKHVWDMDYRNNNVIYLKFTRPNPNPVQ
jgi:hypothetical protein